MKLKPTTAKEEKRANTLCLIYGLSFGFIAAMHWAAVIVEKVL